MTVPSNVPDQHSSLGPLVRLPALPHWLTRQGAPNNALAMVPVAEQEPLEWCDVLLDFTHPRPGSVTAAWDEEAADDIRATTPGGGVEECRLVPVVSGGPFAGVSGSGGIWASSGKATDSRVLLVDTGNLRVGFRWARLFRQPHPQQRLAVPLIEVLQPPTRRDMETGTELPPFVEPDLFVQTCLAQTAAGWPLFIRAIESAAQAARAGAELVTDVVLHHLGLASIGLLSEQLPSEWASNSQRSTLGWELQPWLAYGWSATDACAWLDLDPSNNTSGHVRRWRTARRWHAHEVAEWTGWVRHHRDTTFAGLDDAEVMDWFLLATNMTTDDKGNPTEAPRLPWVQAYMSLGVRDATTLRLFHHVGLAEEMTDFLARTNRTDGDYQGLVWDYIEAWRALMPLADAAWAVASGMTLVEATRTFGHPSAPKPDRSAFALLAGFRPRNEYHSVYLEDFLANHRP